MTIKYKDYTISYKENTNKWIVYEPNSSIPINMIQYNSLKEAKMLIDICIEERIKSNTKNTNYINILFKGKNIKYNEKHNTWDVNIKNGIFQFSSLFEAKNEIESSYNNITIIIDNAVYKTKKIFIYKDKKNEEMIKFYESGNCNIPTILSVYELINKDATIIKKDYNEKILIFPENIKTICENN